MSSCRAGKEPRVKGEFAGVVQEVAQEVLAQVAMINPGADLLQEVLLVVEGVVQLSHSLEPVSVENRLMRGQ